MPLLIKQEGKILPLYKQQLMFVKGPDIINSTVIFNILIGTQSVPNQLVLRSPRITFIISSSLTGIR